MARAVLLYDSDCGFCRWMIGRMQAWDRKRRVRPVALQSPEAGDLLPGLTEQERFASWHLVAGDGTVFSAGRAVAPLLKMMPGGSGLAVAAASCPSLVDRTYRWGARRREDLGRLVGANACAIGPRTDATEGR